MIVRTPPMRVPISALEMIESLTREYHPFIDGSWLIPLVLRSGLPTRWESRLGGRGDLDRLLELLLARRESDPSCFGIHRLQALAVALASGSGRARSSTLSDVRDRLLHEIELEWRDFDDTSGTWTRALKAAPLRTSAMQSSAQSIDASITCQGHILEWFMECPAAFGLAHDQRIHKGASRLVELLQESQLSGRVSYLAWAHAIRALRMYEKQVS